MLDPRLSQVQRYIVALIEKIEELTTSKVAPIVGLVHGLWYWKEPCFKFPIEKGRVGIQTSYGPFLEKR